LIVLIDAARMPLARGIARAVQAAMTVVGGGEGGTIERDVS
jgi:hypothetical protein